MNQTIEKALVAYGGRECWENAQTIKAEVSVQGWAFTLKRRPFFEHAKISMDVKRPYSRLTPIGKRPNVTGVLDGHDVRLEDENGNVLAERKNARSYFPGGRRLLWWDDLDMAYFANYAFWNYFTLPVLLLRSDIDWRELEPGIIKGVFPPEIPTHNTIQQFRFDTESGQLIQHDYTAEIISKLATAAHVIRAHADGYPSDRLVTPRSPKGNALHGPKLIAIQVHNFKVY
jgi:hypothetical protein